MDKTRQELYKERLKRVEDAVQLKEPDRVPFVPRMAFFPAKYYGISCEEYMYDADKLIAAKKKTILDFEPDMYHNPFFTYGVGEICETLDYKQLKWPGHGVPSDVTYQFVEGEYMTADEYDAFISDRSDFLLRVYFPRIFGALEALKRLPDLSENYYFRTAKNIAVLGEPEVAATLESLLKAGKQAKKMVDEAAKLDQDMRELGFPPMFGSYCHAPFDYIGDFYRGTRGIMLDMYRNPDKLLKAIDTSIPMLTGSAIAQGANSDVPYVFIPLHKGLDGFMSLEQFKTFYWPSLREIMVELINAGLIPCPLWEGDCTSRLEIIKDIPPGKAIYCFERTDMFEAKKILGDRVCIRGNVLASQLNAGTPNEIRDYCKRLIDVVAKDGGFIMDGAAGIPDEANPENVKVWADFTREYGIYK